MFLHQVPELSLADGIDMSLKGEDVIKHNTNITT